MAGIRELLPFVAQTLETNMAISNPSRTLNSVRILGSTDPNYGTVGWVPPNDGTPFGLIELASSKASTPETNRIWMTYEVFFFIGIEKTDTPNVVFNFNDQATGWMDSAIQVIASNRRLLPQSNMISPEMGDVQWEIVKAKVTDRKYWNVSYYGVDITTTIRIVYSVNYQY